MGVDKKFLTESYRRMSEKELLSILNEYNDLTPEAQEALRDEIVSRGMGEGIETAIDRREKGVSDEILFEFAEMIRKMACPHCSGTKKKLNGIIVVNSRYLDYIIGCPDCLQRELSDAQAVSVSMGFIGVTGLLRSVNNLAAYSNYTKDIKEDKPTTALISFIKEKIAEIELYRNKPEKLTALIKHPNAISSS